MTNPVAPVALVTGAASGIGEATARLYAERGHRVVAVDVQEEGLAKLAVLDGVETLVGDVAAERTSTDAVQLALDRFGRLDAVVLNAGIGGAGPLESHGAIERFDRLFAVNVRSVALGIRAAVPALRAAGGGAIVATSSVSGLRGDPGTWGYNATKAAVINLVRAAAIDYAAQNIRINAIAPGGTATAMTAGQLADPEFSQSITSRIPAHRWASPREQAEVIWFLTSPAASYVTGVTVPVDGGLSANGGILPPPPARDRIRTRIRTRARFRIHRRTAMSSTVSIEDNKAVARRYFEEFVDRRRLDLLEEIVAEDAADETRVGVGGNGTREDFREHAQWLWENVKDVHVTVSDLVAEGDRVIVFWRIEGFHEGNVFGVPGTGKHFTGHSISWLTIRDGKVVRYNVLPDRLGIVQQLAESHL